METSGDDRMQQNVAVSQKKNRGICGRVLRAISFGQFKTKLYYREQDQHSSVLGGVVSLICGIFLASYAVVVLYSTIFTSQKIYTLSEETITFETAITNFTVAEYIDAMNGTIVISYPLEGQKFCENTSVVIFGRFGNGEGYRI